METKLVRVPFDLELAERIQNGECTGRIITREGKRVRIICFDAQNIYPIIALIKENNKQEKVINCILDGRLYKDTKTKYDLILEVPEYMTFKDGDIVTFGWGDKDGKYYCEWISIIKSIEADEHEISTEDYVSLYLKYDGYDNLSPINFDCYSDGAKWARYSTVEEKQKLIDELKESKNPKAKECLIKLGIEEKPKCQFKDGDIVRAYNYIIIVKNPFLDKKGSLNFNAYISYDINTCSFDFTDGYYKQKKVRYANKEELEILKKEIIKSKRGL